MNTIMSLLAATAWSEVGLDLLTRVTLILLIVVVIDRVLVYFGKTLVRSAAWHACLAGLLVLPFASLLVVPTVSLTNSFATLAQETESSGFSEFKSEEPTSIPSVEPSPKESDSSPPATFQNGSESSDNAKTASFPKRKTDAHQKSTASFREALPWLVFLTLSIGYMVSIVRLTFSIHLTHRLRKRAIIIEDPVLLSSFQAVREKLAIRRDISIASSDDVRVPMVVGAWNPMVLIPRESIDNLNWASSTSSRCVLLHELAHVKRADHWWNLLLKIVSVVYWFHPLIWFARKRIIDVREQACDDYCVHVIGEASAYGSTLIDIAARLIGSAPAPRELAAVRKSNLARRINAIRNSDGNEFCVASVTTRLIWLASLSIVAMTVCSISAYPLRAEIKKPPLQASSPNKDDEDLFEFDDERKKLFAELLEKGENEVESVAQKSAILKMVATRNKENFARIKTWHATYKKEYKNFREDVIQTSLTSGRFMIDVQSDSIFTTNEPDKILFTNPTTGVERVAQNMRPSAGQWIATPEHVLSLEVNGNGRNIRRNSLLRGKTGVMVDPRAWFAPNGWTVWEYLELNLKYTDREGFWDRASLAKHRIDNGIEYRLKLISGVGGLKEAKRESLSVFEYRFSEHAGFHMTAKSSRSSWQDTTVEFSYQKVNNAYLPVRRFEKYDMRIPSGETAHRESTTKLSLIELNRELPKRVFTIEQFQLRENDNFVDDIEGEISFFIDGKLHQQDVDILRKFDRFNHQGRKYLMSGEWPDRSQDHQIARTISNYRLWLIANDRGGIERVELATGDQEDEIGVQKFADVAKAAERIRSLAKVLGTTMSQKMRVTLVPGKSLTESEIERAKEALTFDITLLDGSKKTLPEIIVRKGD